MGAGAAVDRRSDDEEADFELDATANEADDHRPPSAMAASSPTILTRSRMYALIAVCLMSVGSHLYVALVHYAPRIQRQLLDKG